MLSRQSTSYRRVRARQTHAARSAQLPHLTSMQVGAILSAEEVKPRVEAALAELEKIGTVGAIGLSVVEAELELRRVLAFCDKVLAWQCGSP